MTAADSLPPADRIQHSHLHDLQDWTAAELHALFGTTDVMAQVMQRTIKKVPALQGFTVGLLFFEDSTRTRLSFDRAARAQSADVVTFSSGGSSLSKGESLRDTIETIDAMQADLYVVRHPVAGATRQISQWTDAAIVNAGDGRRAHPTQALLDAYTFSRSYEGTGPQEFAGKKLAIIGDIVHSRVARSNISLWRTLGAEVTLCGPRTLLPEELAGDGVTLTHDVNEAVEGAHAVMALRLQTERMQAGLLPSLAEYVDRYQLRSAHMKLADEHALVMHPGPMNRDLELEGALADSKRSVILKQVANGVPVRMAVLYNLLVGRR